MSKVAINWFEIPVADLERAASFYTTVMGINMMPMETPSGEIRAFLNGDTPVGALSKSPHNNPAPTGSLIYFDADGQIEAILGRVEQSGGKVVLPKTSIGAHGHIAQFVDCEGNRVALHSM